MYIYNNNNILGKRRNMNCGTYFRSLLLLLLFIVSAVVAIIIVCVVIARVVWKLLIGRWWSLLTVWVWIVIVVVVLLMIIRQEGQVTLGTSIGVVTLSAAFEARDLFQRTLRSPLFVVVGPQVAQRTKLCLFLPD